MRIAIAGPDGAGKSSICKALSKHIDTSTIIYAGKSDFRFRSTGQALALWKKVSKWGRVPALLIQYFIYYPLEYIDNLGKFRVKNGDKTLYIYDRHPLDRMMMKQALLLRRQARKINRLTFYAHYPFCWFWGMIYKKFFPAIDVVFVLLPEPQLCLVRGGNQYSDFDEAKIRVKAYEFTLAELEDTHYRILKVDTETTIEAACSEILKELTTGVATS